MKKVVILLMSDLRSDEISKGYGMKTKKPNKQIMLKKLARVFSPKSIAVIGASETPNKVGNVVMKNFIEGGYEGKIFPVNPKHEKVMGLKCYKSVLDVKDGIDCVIVATPAEIVPKIIEQCGKKKVGGVIVLSGGFSEAG